MRDGIGSFAPGARRSGYLLALVGALLLGLATALPVFAQEATTEEDQPVQPEVVGGDSVPNGKYPFMASLQDVRYGRSGYERHFCGGTLIDRDSVLTAAHCLYEYSSQGVQIGRTPTEKLRVVVGVTELNSDQGSERRVERAVVHPRYDGNRSDAYDAAVIELTNPVRFAPIPLAPAAAGNKLERQGRLATVAGWGNTRKQGPDFSQPDSFPNRMQEARPPIVSDARAETIYDRGYFSRLMVAAGKEGVDTCQGDSGGPLWATTNAGRRQIGIVSTGVGCATRQYPGIYTEVNAPSISSFIKETATR